MVGVVHVSSMWMDQSTLVTLPYGVPCLSKIWRKSIPKEIRLVSELVKMGVLIPKVEVLTLDQKQWKLTD